MLGQEIPMTKKVKRYNKFSQYIKVLNLNIGMTYKLSILHLQPNCFNLENINYRFLHLSKKIISDKVSQSSHQV